jgi:hypothetical protein
VPFYTRFSTATRVRHSCIIESPSTHRRSTYPTPAMRCFATSMYSALVSPPMNLRPSCLQATAVEPVPQKGSTTKSPGSVYVLTKCSINSTGFSVGCVLDFGA